MLNKFCFHLHAQKSLFIAENCNEFFLTAATTREFGVHGAGSQLKIAYQILKMEDFFGTSFNLSKLPTPAGVC